MQPLTKMVLNFTPVIMASSHAKAWLLLHYRKSTCSDLKTFLQVYSAQTIWWRHPAIKYSPSVHYCHLQLTQPGINPYWWIFGDNIGNHCDNVKVSGGSRISPRRGRQLSKGGRGAPTYDFAKFSQKLHDIERIWTPRGGGGARVQNFTM